MAAIFQGLDREAIAASLQRGHFFWVDVSLTDTTPADLRETLGLPEHALEPLLRFGDDSPPSRKFHADGDHVVFPFSCFLDSSAVEVHVVVSGDYVLTIHEEPLALTEVIPHEIPEGRSEQYVVYVILDAMVTTGFDALNDVWLTLENIQLGSTDLRSSRVRLATVRSLNTQLSGMRRRVAPERGTFERISEEIGLVEGLGKDSEMYFERITAQLNRLVGGIDAAADAMSKLIGLRLNETIYWLTVVATVFLPLTFITGFFGMNFGWLVKHIASPLAFVVLGIGAQVAAVAITLWVVRRRGTPVDER
jgi:magnesium transporter